MKPVPDRTLSTCGGTVHVFANQGLACEAVAQEMISVIGENGRAVLGLSTGSTPVSVYKSLVAAHLDKEVSFRNVTTYNLDEYYPIGSLDPNSYRSYMHHHLFSHVDLKPNQAHVLDGTVPREFVARHCDEYDRWIEADGGLDVQLLGIGRNGHIGFNEPTDAPAQQLLRTRTRLVELHPMTAQDAARDFGGDVGRVPRQALTMGVATILSARSILISAFGRAKAPAVAAALHGPVTAQCPASLLQTVASKRPVKWFVDFDALDA